MNKLKKLISLLLIITLLASVTLLSSCGEATPTPTPKPSFTPIPSPTPKSSDYKVEFGDFHTALQAEFLAGNYDAVLDFANGRFELSRPNPIVIDFSTQVSTDEGSYFFELATNEKFTDGKIYELSSTDIELYNLFLATTYYYRAATSRDDLKSSSSQTFTTTDKGPRNLYVDGVTNVRDLGGWLTTDGRRTNQGLLFRGGRLNESSADTVVIEITADGKKVFLEDLKIKTDLDLRTSDDNEIGSITSSPVEELNYVLVSMDFTEGIFANKEQIKTIFALLSDENNYPIYYHCNIGTDRTGIISFLVNGICGVTEENMFTDYLFSNFGKIGGPRNASYLDYTTKGITESEGETFEEKTVNCLLSCGVTMEQIEAVRKIMLPAK